MQKNVRSLLVFVALFLTATPQLFSQSLIGTIKDGYSDVLPGVIVTLEGTRANAVTDGVHFN